MSDLDRLSFDLQNAGDRVGAKANAVIREVANEIKDAAKSFAPVRHPDGGATRDSIGVDMYGDGRSRGITAVIGSTTYYSIFLENGTAKMAPRAFMGPALDRHSGEVEQKLADAAKDIL